MRSILRDNRSALTFILLNVLVRAFSFSSKVRPLPFSRTGQIIRSGDLWKTFPNANIGIVLYAWLRQGFNSSNETGFVIETRLTAQIPFLPDLEVVSLAEILPFQHWVA